MRIGPGAAILPKDVKRIHLEFARKINDGHNGARKLWRKCLPRLKYHNPAVSMTINRTSNQEGPSTLTVFFAPCLNSTEATASSVSSSSPDASPALDLSKRVEIIDMKHKREGEILSRLLEVTSGRPYETSPEEHAELREIEDYRRSSQTDRKAQARLNEVKRQEKALLDQARGLTDAS